MKVYISADIEGTAGIAHWDEASPGKIGYDVYAELMTQEVIAACEGALNAGAEKIVIKDAHGTGRNILADKLPREAHLIRGWSGHPWAMIQGIDGTYDALVMTGYHSGACTGGHPLAHTMNSGVTHALRINGEIASEFVVNRMAAATVGVPTVFISGDRALCESAKALDSSIHTSTTMDGIGDSTIAPHPDVARDGIRSGIEAALKDEAARTPPTIPDTFHLEVVCIKHKDAYSAAFYPGMESTGPHTLSFRNDDFFEITRAMKFAIDS
jgi:D-amino peptidase